MRKGQAHILLDQLDPGQFDAVSRLLEVMADPLARRLAAASPDDEPVTERDRRRFHEGEAWFAERGGKGIPMDEVLAAPGIDPNDVARLIHSARGPHVLRHQAFRQQRPIHPCGQVAHCCWRVVGAGSAQRNGAKGDLNGR